jgi:uncharacterized protein (DUF433 family)
MVTVETHYKHIVLDERDVPLIAGTTMKVIELVTARKAYGWSPEELVIHFPYLTLGQVYSALAYYADHQTELDEDMARRLAWVDELRSRTPEPPVVARLRELKTY